MDSPPTHGTGSPQYGRIRRAPSASNPPNRQRILASLVVGVLLGSTLVVAVLGLSPRSTIPCSTCVLGDIDAGYGPVDMVYDNASGHLFVLDSGPGGFNAWGVTVINGSTDTVAGFYHVGQRPGDLAYDSRNGELYVTGFCSDNVYVLNATTGANVTWIPTPSIPLCEGPIAIAYDPADGLVDVLQGSSPSLLMISGATDQIVGHVNISAGTYPLATNPLTGQIYLTTNLAFDDTSFNVTTLNGSSGAVDSSVQLNGSPTAIAFDDRNDHVYVAVTVEGSGEGNLYNGSLLALDRNASRVVTSSRIGDNPYEIAVDGSNGNVYVTNADSNNISVVNGSTGQVTGSIPVDLDPWSVVYDGENACLYALFYTHFAAGGSGGDGYVSVVAPPGSDCPAPPTSPSVPLWIVTAVSVLIASSVVFAVAWTRWLRKLNRR
jgi:YVTN family beta-propeller protein